MEITYLAHSCFEIKTKELSLIIDPFDARAGVKKMPNLKCDALLLTHHHEDHANLDIVSNYRLLVESPGEYEIAGLSIMGFPTFHDESEGSERGPNTVYLMEDENNNNILHLGDLGHELSKQTLEKLPDIDVLLIPVGGVYTIDAEKASKVIASLEPKIVVPMHYQTPTLDLGVQLDGVEKFLNEMGAENPRKENKLKIPSAINNPEETEVVLLTPQA